MSFLHGHFGDQLEQVANLLDLGPTVGHFQAQFFRDDRFGQEIYFLDDDYGIQRQDS